MEDETVEIQAGDVVVELGLGAIGYVHPGAVVDVTAGAIAYLAPGAQLLEDRPGALERGDYTVTEWVDHPRCPVPTRSVSHPETWS